jgi:asparagine synthase (glutamine-hydrolysing)
MFAFFIYDQRRNRGFLARDHFGIKPLYHHFGRDVIAFASEPKALLVHPEIEARLDTERVGDYLSFQHCLDEGTLFQGIRKVLPGHSMTIDLKDGLSRDRIFWEPNYVVDPSVTEEDAIEYVDALVQDAVRIQLRSDVPVGAYLSGGLDSSLITAMASQQAGGDFEAFHGRFAEAPRYDESRYADIVAERTGADLHKVVPSAERFANRLPSMIHFMDEPAAGPGLFPQFEVSELASIRVRVVLGGQGGDEIFCGYTRYLVAYLEQALKTAIFQTSSPDTRDLQLSNIMASMPQLQEYVPMMRRFWKNGLFEDTDRRYFRLIDRTEGASHLYTEGFLREVDHESTFARFQEVFNHPATESYIAKMRNFDRVAFMPALLHVEDRVSMAHSLESRVPLLDYRIADYVDRLKPGIIFREGRHKHLLREVAARHLPWEVVLRRDKMGFPVPLDLWLKKGVVRDFVRDVFASRRCRERGVIDTKAVEAHFDKAQPFSRALWGVLNLELWHQIFIDGLREIPSGRDTSPIPVLQPDRTPVARSAAWLKGGDTVSDINAHQLGRIGVVGPGIVGMPMAALLAGAAKNGYFGPDAHVVVVQRDSPTSGWKVKAINDGRSPIGGIEPGLDELVGETVKAGKLSATHDFDALSDASVVLVCVQTDKQKGANAPDYGPMMSALDTLCASLAKGKATRKEPVLLSFESTLAPSSMASVIRDKFREYDLEEGRDVLLGNSPNRVMPGRLLERIDHDDKLAGGLARSTAARIASMYAALVTKGGKVHRTNSLTAEVVKTVENCYRDVRIAYAAEIARWCDANDVDFLALRDAVNERMNDTDIASQKAEAVPTGAMLMVFAGVGGHCLPKDGILLRWRFDEADASAHERSLIHLARAINDESPGHAVQLAEEVAGPIDGKTVAVLGAAYRADSDDIRNGPGLDLVRLLQSKGCTVRLQDAFVRPDDIKVRQPEIAKVFTTDFEAAIDGAEVVIVTQAHKPYRDGGAALFAGRADLKVVCDAGNTWQRADFEAAGVPYVGVSRGRKAPDSTLVDAAYNGLHAIEVGFANELAEVVRFLNDRYAENEEQKIDFAEAQRLAETCATGCNIVDPAEVAPWDHGIEGLTSRMVELARATKPG